MSKVYECAPNAIRWGRQSRNSACSCRLDYRGLDVSRYTDPDTPAGTPAHSTRLYHQARWSAVVRALLSGLNPIVADAGAEGAREDFLGPVEALTKVME